MHSSFNLRNLFVWQLHSRACVCVLMLKILVLEESSPLFRQGVQVYEIKVMCKELYLAYNSTYLYDICIVNVVFARSVYLLHLLVVKLVYFIGKLH